MTSHLSGHSWNSLQVGASLQHAISLEPRISFLRVQSTCWCIDAVVSCIMWWNLRQF